MHRTLLDNVLEHDYGSYDFNRWYVCRSCSATSPEDQARRREEEERG